MNGWISIHRQIKNHWVFKNDQYFKAWITIILEVNHHDNKVLIDSELIDCKRGQSLNSLQSWCNIFGKNWSIQKLRTFFKMLENDSMIQLEGLRKTTRLTVCKYDSYQVNQHTNNKQTTSKQHTDNTQVTTNNKDNKENKDIYRSFQHLSLSVLDFNKLEIEYTKEQIDSVLDAVENYKLNKNYKSLYLTVKQWLKKYPKKSEIKKTPKSLDEIAYENIMKQIELYK